VPATTPLVNGEWETFVAEVDAGDATGYPEQSPPEVMAMTAVDGGFVAAGTLHGRFAVWRSEDLRTFALLHHDRSDNPVNLIPTIVVWGDRLLVAAWGDDTWVESISWDPDDAFTDPWPSDWPVQQVSILDGPSEYVYGRITRVADDEITFSIEEVGPVMTFRPRPADTEVGSCG
jgi:hypothetical protein